MSQPIPNPCPMTSSQAESMSARTVHQFRFLDCAAYGKCLATAAKQKWASFHCQSCQAYVAAKPNRVEDYLRRTDLDPQEPF